ncbi:Cation diffusion facilitator family transporter [Sterolibacterium denitrificans]|uniref:Cation diffusion facilitator family transporter n=1 Tax=Sterolibacterium denitrificans TaxID=157592 RepID=A0A7Z7HR19_9PROT|nr:cation diffusion facilitator family transporter [Sterolibacterium denitrificans]SMB22192.1 Cation diffusion facilitator family transporter [Sterolibacterium denitrificans]
MPSKEPLLRAEPHREPQRYREVRKVTWVSVGVNLVLTTAQIFIGLLAHAQSLVADGFHSLSDLVADLMVLVGNHHSRHPADERHPYGHQRIETAVSLALGLLLIGTGAAILWSAATRLQHLDELPQIAPYALWAALATLVAKEALFRYMLAVAERLRSPMLVANAWHARSDAASSLVVAVGLAGSMAGYRFLDPVAAIIVGFLILRMGAKFAYEAMQELVDTALSDEEIQRIRDTLQTTPGVIGLHELRTRRMAHQVLADAHIQVDARISVSEGHRIAEAARQRVLAAHPDVLDVLVHVDVEKDVPPSAGVAAPALPELPERAVLLLRLRQALGAGDASFPPFEKALLHYLGNQVDVELFLPPEFCGDPARMRLFEQRAAACLETLPWLRAISLNCRVFPPRMRSREMRQ